MSIALRFWWEKIRKAFGSWQSNLRSGILITTICMVNGNGLHTLILLANSKNQSTRNQHLRRPKGSQSGREKRRDESFQVRAKKPLGTDSYRTISKNSRGCRLLIGHKKCFVLLCPIGETVSPEFFPWVRTRRLLSCHTCPVRSPSLYAQEKLLFSTFQTRNEETTDESKKRLGCYQQDQFNLPREYSVFDSSQYIVNNRKFKMRRRRESQISNSLTRQKKALHMHHTFLYIFCHQLHNYPWKCLISHVLWST